MKLHIVNPIYLSFFFTQADADAVFGFVQTFYLKQFGDGLFIMNDFFRLALHNQ